MHYWQHSAAWNSQRRHPRDLRCREMGENEETSMEIAKSGGPNILAGFHIEQRKKNSALYDLLVTSRFTSNASYRAKNTCVENVSETC